jgi:hypothetical protein
MFSMIWQTAMLGKDQSPENSPMGPTWVLRGGDAYSGNGAVESVKECYSRLHKRVWLIVRRGDSASFSGRTMDTVDYHFCPVRPELKLTV